MLRRYLLLVSSALVLFIMAAIGATADDDDNNPPSNLVTQVAAIEAEASNVLEVLRRGRVAGDALPPEYAGRMNEKASFGMNPGLSRRAIGNLTHSVYVIPARGHVCASLTDGQGATVICPPLQDLIEGNVGAATVALETGDVAVYGVVPDGVGSISVLTGSSSSIDVPTEENAYYTVVPSHTRLRAVSYVGPSGPVEFPIYDPTIAAEGG